MAKTNLGLVEYAKAQLGLPYWYGTYGLTATKKLYDSKKKQYPKQYQWDCPANQLGKRVHDCVGLIKGYLWSDTPTSTPKYNANQDVSANGMLNVCKEKGPIDTIPDIPGILVFLPGHVGVYIGNGYVIEAKGHAYGVVKTRLAGRGWKNWGKCPWIDYTAKTTTPTATVTPVVSNPAPSASTQPKFKKGDLVKIIGTQYYNGKKIPLWVRLKKWYVKEVIGDRVIIDKSQDGKNSICSPIKAKDLKKM